MICYILGKNKSFLDLDEEVEPLRDTFEKEENKLIPHPARLSC
jgi:hypothetical protein